MTRVVIIILAALLLILPLTFPVQAWGPYGHELSARAAVQALPGAMPAFFLEAAGQLVYLNPEPDRWRDSREADRDPALNQAHGPEHYLNLELVPDGALEADNRIDYLHEIGDGPLPGLSSFRMLELFQRVRLEFRLWREETDPEARSWIEQRIINDAGILGHYVTDAANPLHTSIHFNGWVGPNPNGYATNDGIHQRFEGAYVTSRVTLADLESSLDRPLRVWGEPRREILDLIEESFALVEPLYALDRVNPFGERSDSPENHAFVVERLASGALALRDAWWSAWVTSDPEF